ncbi:MAG: ACP S-malonyltransferase [Rhodospirillaceae bacterium]|nr:ACP S-malonyltransferase [Rhodospirillaceae bacterium]MYF87875.1 ACP S-malonyltransferase [Rhodospirillaceae bacterium]MYH36096.1 ACP S-malonyltransferase [Rhodospirillaceae bacterium]MYK14801.1 ACP S-malonyltransferase [Rhodospirillaceae bacterium]MYK58390.1 ACP S-malonyltransferase [Rhodospirillaceae bacterium]
MAERIFVFPGQGSQAVGMGRDLAEASAVARLVFEEVNDALSQSLSRLMFDGPGEELTLTENAQPALMAVSMAVLRTLEEAGLALAEKARFVAGHSLGEYSALCAAGAFSLADTARLLKARGRAMQAAVPVGDGAMAALLGAALEQAEEAVAAAAGDEVCAIANDNATGQVVISGHAGAIDRAIAAAQDMGVRRAMKLQVSAPFHCSLMQPAADVMAEELERVPPGMPAVPLIANVTAQAVSDGPTIRGLLVQQVTGLVRWRESMLFARDEGCGELVELGAGKVLATMARRIDPEITGTAVNSPDDIDKFLAAA